MKLTSLLKLHRRRSDRVNCTEEQGSKSDYRRHAGFIQNEIFLVSSPLLCRQKVWQDGDRSSEERATTRQPAKVFTGMCPFFMYVEFPGLHHFDRRILGSGVRGELDPNPGRPSTLFYTGVYAIKG
jgi:hypothetical protein